MRQISLREFRTRGSKALEAVPQGETILLSGHGPLANRLSDTSDESYESQTLSPKRDPCTTKKPQKGFDKSTASAL